MKKIISIIAAIILTGYGFWWPGNVWGQEVPPPPPPPPSIPTAPPRVEAPTPPPPPAISEKVDPISTPEPQITSEPKITEEESKPIVRPTTVPTNDISDNSGGQVGEEEVNSGNSNVSGTVVSAVNTNLNNLDTNRTSVTDNQVGNIVLNGTGSSNQESQTNSQTSSNNQNNNAQIGNELTLAADSGNNNASYNTGGDSVITTGNANVSANSLVFANNNLQGKVIYQVVDIYDTLTGDIILPEEAYSTIEGNGASSNNQIQNSSDQRNSVDQNNEANIDNQIVTETNTGQNVTAYNTDGNSTVVTGNSSTQVKTLNVANNNIGPGNWWIVIINKAGEWVGEVIGGKTSNLNSETQGDTTTISNNGAGSNNQEVITNNQTDSNTQNNNAIVGNKLNLSANTGRNIASYNTGGDSKIKTGNANIIANVANFVNNNVATGGRLIVTVVNVFGKWLGDFVPPGFSSAKTTADKQQPTTDANIQTNPVTQKSASPTPTVIHVNSATNVITQVNPTPLPNVINVGRMSGGVFRRVYFPTPIPEPIVMQNQISNNGEVLAAQAPPTKREININLAWLLFGLPIAALAWMRQHFS